MRRSSIHDGARSGMASTLGHEVGLYQWGRSEVFECNFDIVSIFDNLWRIKSLGYLVVLQGGRGKWCIDILLGRHESMS